MYCTLGREEKQPDVFGLKFVGTQYRQLNIARTLRWKSSAFTKILTRNSN